MFKEFIKGKLILAPMAGVADNAFRELCVKYGATYTISEMVSSKGLIMHDRKSKELIKINDSERPCAIQLFGNEPEIMAKAVYEVLESNPVAIDINMGCPAPKIASNGGGSALLKEPELAQKIVKAVVRETDLPVTVKLRSGWDDENIVAVEFAKRFEQAGAAAITVHGRTRTQMYAPPVDYNIIKAVKSAVSIPVIGNGDIIDGKSAKYMLETTKCDAIMVGRGALGRPWVFKNISDYLETGVETQEPPVSERVKIMLEHIELICKYKGEKIGMLEARKHAAWYTKGIRGSAQLRQEITSISTFEDLKRISEKI